MFAGSGLIIHFFKVVTNKTLTNCKHFLEKKTHKYSNKNISYEFNCKLVQNFRTFKLYIFAPLTGNHNIIGRIFSLALTILVYPPGTTASARSQPTLVPSSDRCRPRRYLHLGFTTTSVIFDVF